MRTDPHGRLFVAGGTGGDACVVDTRTGRVLAYYRLATGPAFVNDVILTQGAAWFTDSTNPVLYKLPLRDGQLLHGRTLFAVENGVQNKRSALAVLRLNAAGTDGRVVRRVRDARFDVPATVAAFGPRLYLPNARFTTSPTLTITYTAVAIPRP
ncbi:hypothetical protein [Streptosporangium roseum]|uniref:hypothetical protein n=1 Tax=Streptosporangium roseum TaxID=2001 RepID=UPI0001A3E606|nr:hypothetical protein [Streptosporangium roseum]